MGTNTPPTAAGPRAVITDGVRTALGVGGLVAIALGLLILVFPGKSAAVAMTIVAILVAAYAFVVGVTYLATAFFTRTLTGWGRTGRVLLGLLYLAAGVIMVVNLEASAVVLAAFLTITIGILWIVEAILSFTLVAESESKAWAIIFGIVGLIAGIVLILSPLFGAITLWLFLGVSMLAMGIVQVIRAFRVGA